MGSSSSKPDARSPRSRAGRQRVAPKDWKELEAEDKPTSFKQLQQHNDTPAIDGCTDKATELQARGGDRTDRDQIHTFKCERTKDSKKPAKVLGSDGDHSQYQRESKKMAVADMDAHELHVLETEQAKSERSGGPQGLESKSEDHDDLYLFEDNSGISANVSANLVNETNKDTIEESHASVWEAPKEAGLANSLPIDEAIKAGTGWYRTDADAHEQKSAASSQPIHHLTGDDADDADLFEDNSGISANVSGNLVNETNKDTIEESHASVWEAPREAGLANSLPIDEAIKAGTGWYRTDVDAHEQKSTASSQPILRLTSDELDDQDLFAEDSGISANVSGNLVNEANKDTIEQAHHSVWEAPEEAGLQNSMSVDEAAKAGTGWYQTDSTRELETAHPDLGARDARPAQRPPAHPPRSEVAPKVAARSAPRGKVEGSASTSTAKARSAPKQKYVDVALARGHGGKAAPSKSTGTSAKTSEASQPRDDDELDDQDLFAEDSGISANVSGNLVNEANKDTIEQAHHSVWEAPEEAGLQNSMSVDEAAKAGTGWYQTDSTRELETAHPDLGARGARPAQRPPAHPPRSEVAPKVAARSAPRGKVEGSASTSTAKARSAPKQKYVDVALARGHGGKAAPSKSTGTSAKTSEASQPRDDDELDDQDLFAEDSGISANVSGNLVNEANKDTIEQAHHSVWEAPEEAGLQNSMSVDEAAKAGTGWYQTDSTRELETAHPDLGARGARPAQRPPAHPPRSEVAPKVAARSAPRGKVEGSASTSTAKARSAPKQKYVDVALARGHGGKAAPSKSTGTSAKTSEASQPRDDDELDDQDLFAEDSGISANVSGNLVNEANKDTIEQAHHSVWEAPEEAGLQNSMSVDEAAKAGTGWYQNDSDAFSALAEMAPATSRTAQNT